MYSIAVSAMTLNSLNTNASTSGVNDNKRVTMLGSMLFLRCVSGSRVVSTIEQKELSGYKFEGEDQSYFDLTSTCRYGEQCIRGVSLRSHHRVKAYRAT